MIIVEGPDGSGKSTLIKNLGLEAKRLKSIRGGIGGTKFDGSGDGQAGWGGIEPALVAYTRKVMEAKAAEAAYNSNNWVSEKVIAFDRFHLSEHVYGPILRGKQEMNDPDLQWLSAFLREERVKVVMCLPTFVVTLANVTQNGRERPAYQTEAFLHQAWKEFERLAPWASVVYDYTRDPLPTI